VRSDINEVLRGVACVAFCNIVDNVTAYASDDLVASVSNFPSLFTYAFVPGSFKIELKGVLTLGAMIRAQTLGAIGNVLLTLETLIRVKIKVILTLLTGRVGHTLCTVGNVLPTRLTVPHCVNSMSDHTAQTGHFLITGHTMWKNSVAQLTVRVIN
jgi:hypothetical protein